MRTLLGLLALVAAVWDAAPALAGDSAQREFAIEFGARDEALRDDCSRRLAAWWDEIVSPDRPPKDWDERQFGPWSLVARTSGGGFVEERPGLIRGIVDVNADGLPSRDATAGAYADAIVRALVERASARAVARLRDARAPIESEVEHLRVTLRLASTDLRIQLEAKGVADGVDVAREAGDLGDRVTELRGDLSRTRIDRAVAARKLEAARAAAARAADVERLRRDADAAAVAAERTDDPNVRAEIEAKVEALRRKLDELARSAPSLDAAREEVFRQEVDLVGLEARTTALEEEVRETAARLAEIRSIRAFVERKVRDIDAAEARLADAQDRLRAADLAASRPTPAAEVIRRPAPPSSSRLPPKEEKR